MSGSWADTVRQVVARANGRCEYCRMHQSLQGATFHVEHVVPRTAGGGDEAANLCLACPSCKLHKSSRTTATDPDSGAVVPLFRPTAMAWAEHFTWDGVHIVGRTPIGRGTVELLNLNADRRQRIRQAESLFDLFPPHD